MTYYCMTATVLVDVSEYLSDEDRREGIFGYRNVDNRIECFNSDFDAQITFYTVDDTEWYGVFDVNVTIEFTSDEITFEEWKSYEYDFCSYLGENWRDVEFSMSEDEA